jgi:hypothetical protein
VKRLENLKKENEEKITLLTLDLEQKNAEFSRTKKHFEEMVYNLYVGRGSIYRSHSAKFWNLPL